MFDQWDKAGVRHGRAGKQARWARHRAGYRAWAEAATASCFLMLLLVASAAAQTQTPSAQIQPPHPPASPQPAQVPPRVLEAQRFLRERGWAQGRRMPPRVGAVRHAGSASTEMRSVQSSTASGNTWQPLGPAAVQTPNFGLVSGRVSALALDPSDATGNRLYVGTTGGGVWVANNAAVSTPSSIVFTPLTDTVAALGGAPDASISIGALTVQPGGTGVVLAGTGDPNDVLDSYYGAGILRSTDGGNTWTLIQQTVDRGGGHRPQRSELCRQGLCGFCLEHGQSSTCGGGGLAGL